VHGILLAALLLKRTISVLKLRRPEFGLTGSCIEEDPCNIWPECFVVLYRSRMSFFLSLIRKYLRHLVRYRSKMEYRLTVYFKCVNLFTVLQ